MTITIKYFGVLAEETGKDEESLDLDSSEISVDELKEHCYSTYAISDTESIQVAVNQNIGATGSIHDGDEVAFLPPFSGG